MRTSNLQVRGHRLGLEHNDCVSKWRSDCISVLHPPSPVITKWSPHQGWDHGFLWWSGPLEMKVMKVRGSDICTSLPVASSRPGGSQLCFACAASSLYASSRRVQVGWGIMIEDRSRGNDSRILLRSIRNLLLPGELIRDAKVSLISDEGKLFHFFFVTVEKVNIKCIILVFKQLHFNSNCNE